MTEIVDLSRVCDLAPAVVRAIEDGGSVCVRGRQGSGRSTLAKRVRDSFRNAAFVDLVSMREPDAAVHGLIQASASLSPDSRSHAASDGSPLDARARKVGELLRDRDTVLCIKAPASWDFRIQSDGDGSPDVYEAADLGLDVYQLQRARNFLKGLLQTPRLRVALFTTSTFNPDSVGWSPAKDITLPPSLAVLSVLRDDEFWGRYAPHARTLDHALGGAQVRVSPFVLRLAVGLVALGVPVAQVLTGLYSAGSLTPLSKLLEDELMKPRHEHLREPLYRLAVSRAPVKRDTLLATINAPAEHEPLFDRCIGYGRDEIRVTESVRLMLLDVLGARSDAETDTANMKLAEYHRALDGAPRAADVRPDAMVHWLERVHHLANSGDLGRVEWESIEKHCREFYLDRARLLSVRKQFGAAARLYEKYVELARDDSYGWHYLGYNLDHANTDVDRAELGYRTAIKLDKANPWWNSRCVTFLIKRARFSDAASEWADALDRVDPDGRQVRENPQLAMWLHRWVAWEWLEHGELARARSVMDLIPEAVVQSRSRLRELAARLEDAEEALELGDSVYPESVRVNERWKPRVLLPRKRNGMQLHSWFPGRVLEGSDEGVRIVIATPDRTRVVVTTLDMTQWEAATSDWGASPTDAEQFFIELGVYDRADGPITIIPVSRPTSAAGAN